MVSRFGIHCLALAFLASALSAGTGPGPAPPFLNAGDDSAIFECDDSDVRDGLSPQDGPESAATHAVSALPPPFASVALSRSTDDPPSFEYRSRVFRPPAA